MNRLQRRRLAALGTAGAALVLLAVAGALVMTGADLHWPTSTPPARPPALAGQRPFTPDSAWNTPIAADAPVDPHSREMAATIDRALTSDPAQYSYPVYLVDASTPTYSVAATKYRWTIVDGSGRAENAERVSVPIPRDAHPSRGTDGQMIILDPVSGTEWDLWQASLDGQGWSVSNGSVYNIRWDGMPDRYGSRGAGVPYMAGLIRPWEIATGRIDHAIAFAYPGTARERCVWPASKTDGDDRDQYAIPEGARLRLDPALGEADFDRWGLDRTARIIARALQEYGMILIDGSGRPKIYAEDTVANPYVIARWGDPGLELQADTVSGIPIAAFDVLALPPAYWTGAARPRHGDCLR